MLTDGLGVFVGLVLSGGTRVFTVVGELVSETVSSNGVAVKARIVSLALIRIRICWIEDNSRVDDGSSSSGNHGPDTTLGVEDGQFEGSTGRSIELGNVSFFLGQVTTESVGATSYKSVFVGWGLERHISTHGGGQTIGGPLSAPIREVVTEAAWGLMTEASRAIAHLGPTMYSAVWEEASTVSRRSSHNMREPEEGHLIELGSHVEVEDVGLAGRGVLDSNERVDLEVSEVEVDVDRVEADDKVDEGLETFSSGNVLEEVRLDLFAGRELASNGNEESESLGVDITDVDTSLVGEEDDISLTNGVDADVVLGVGRVGAERFNDEGVEGTSGLLDLFARQTRVSSRTRALRKCRNRDQERT